MISKVSTDGIEIKYVTSKLAEWEGKKGRIGGGKVNTEEGKKEKGEKTNLKNKINK